MRYHRLVILLAFMWACQTVVVTSSSSSDTYSEDLSILRPDLSEFRQDNSSAIRQDNASAEQYSSGDLSIKEELDSVNKIIIQKNSSRRYTDGFTIQIYTGNSDESARAAKDSAEVKFPDLRPVISYNQPTFKVKVGAYYNRLDAHQIFEALKEEFPYALLIPERIPIRYE